MKKLAFFDLDNTLYKGFSAQDFVDLLIRKGYVSEDHQRQLSYLAQQYQSGKVSYTELTNRGIQLIADILAGSSVAEILKLKEEFLGKQDKFYPFVPDLLALLKEANFQIYLVSGGASPAIQMLAETLEIEDYFASEFEIAADSYTGTVTQILNHDAKQTLVEDILNSHTGDIFSLGFGDSTGDVEMLSAVDHAFVINPHQPEMSALVEQHGWHLVTSDTIIDEVRVFLSE